jgi:hypothetical protein
MRYNTGIYSNGFGNRSLINNTGTNSNGFGYFALGSNTGINSNGFGNYSLETNLGNNSNGFGYGTLRYVAATSSNLTAVGHNAASGSSGSPLDFTNATAIGANSTINASNSINLGDASVNKLFIANDEVFYQPLRSGYAGNSGDLFVSQGSSLSPVWTPPSSIPLSSFDNDLSGITDLTAGYLPYWNGTIFEDSPIYTSGDNIGISIVNPTAKLHSYSLNNPDAIKLERGLPGAGIAILFENGNDKQARMWIDGNQFLRFDIGSNIATDTKMTIDSLGNVGINTITPDSLLDVNGGANFSRNIVHPDATLDNQSATFGQLKNVVSDSISSTKHSRLLNLDFASSGHTDFVSTNTNQDISGVKNYLSDVSVSSTSPHFISKYNGAGVGGGLQIWDETPQIALEYGFNNTTDEGYIWTIQPYDFKIGLGNSELFRFNNDKTFYISESTTSPGVPTTGFGALRAGDDGKIYYRNDGGTEYDLTGGGAWIDDANGIYTNSNIGIGDNSLSNAKLYSYNNENGIWAGYFRSFYPIGSSYGVYIQAGDNDPDYALRVLSSGSTDMFNIRGSGKIYAPELTTGTTSNILFIDPTTGLITKDDMISNQTAITSGLESTDEVLISDAGATKKADLSVIEEYLGRVQSLTGTTVSMDALSGRKAEITLTGATTLTITNLPNGGEGTIEVTNGATAYTLDINGDTGYTTEVVVGDKATIDSTVSSHTTVVYWRTGSTLYYGFIYDN